VQLVEAAPWNQPWITRLVVVVNRSSTPRQVRIVADLRRDPAAGLQVAVALDDQGAPAGLCLRQAP